MKEDSRFSHWIQWRGIQIHTGWILSIHTIPRILQDLSPNIKSYLGRSFIPYKCHIFPWNGPDAATPRWTKRTLRLNQPWFDSQFSKPNAGSVPNYRATAGKFLLAPNKVLTSLPKAEIQILWDCFGKLNRHETLWGLENKNVGLSKAAMALRTMALIVRV